MVVRSPSFNERAQHLLDRIVYRLITDERDRDAIFELRYHAYLRDGGIGPDPSERFSDAWDEMPNTRLIGLFLRDQLLASVRVHTSTIGQCDIPAAAVFGDVLEPFFAQGLRLTDATRFVVDTRHTAFAPEMPFLLSRAVTMAAEYCGAYGFLATVRKEHALVYKRASGHRALCEPRTYPLLKKPIVCMLAETASLPDNFYARHPFAVSTVEEREALFGTARSVAPHIIAPQQQVLAVA